jgi:hypothetical protein
MVEHPDRVDSKFYGGCWGCPNDYGYMERPEFCDCCTPDNFLDCGRCWDREIPEVKPAFSIGAGLKPCTITIDCETITLKQKEIGIEFDLGNAHLDNIDTIIINGHTFKKEN